MADEFNGTTVTFPTTSATLGTGLRDTTYEESGADIDQTVSTDSVGSSRPGITREDFSISVLGDSTQGHGDSGKLTVSWADGTSDSIDKVYVSRKSKSGSIDGDVTSTFGFKRLST